MALKNLTKALSDNEEAPYRYYKMQTILAKESSEVVISYLMQNYIMPYEPIMDDLDTFKNLGIEVQFVYGNDNDFLHTDFDNSGKKVSEKLLDLGQECHILENSEHNLQLFEPERLINLLKEFAFNSNENAFNH